MYFGKTSHLIPVFLGPQIHTRQASSWEFYPNDNTSCQHDTGLRKFCPQHTGMQVRTLFENDHVSHPTTIVGVGRYIADQSVVSVFFEKCYIEMLL